MATKKPINHFRARVEIELLKKGKTFADLARAIGKSHQHVHALLERGDPKTSTLKEIADAIGVKPKVLLKEVDPAEYGEVSIPRVG